MPISQDHVSRNQRRCTCLSAWGSCYKSFIDPASIKSTTMNSRLQGLQESPEQSRDENERSLLDKEPVFNTPTDHSLRQLKRTPHQQRLLKTPDATIGWQASKKDKVTTSRHEATTTRFDAKIAKLAKFGQREEGWVDREFARRSMTKHWVDIAADQSFFQVGQAVADKMTLNRLQRAH